MLSPVVLGVKTSVADRFGWAEGAEVTWADIADKARTGQLRYAMTDPAKSNSGFSALASGSEWLKDAYLTSQDELDAMVNYESVLLQLDANLREKLRLIYPKDGVVTAEYPLLLSADRRDDYRAVVNWLRSNKVQARLMAETARRPVTTSVPLDVRFPRRVVAELPFPATFDVCRRLISVYQGFRSPNGWSTSTISSSGIPRPGRRNFQPSGSPSATCTLTGGPRSTRPSNMPTPGRRRAAVTT